MTFSSGRAWTVRPIPDVVAAGRGCRVSGLPPHGGTRHVNSLPHPVSAPDTIQSLAHLGTNMTPPRTTARTFPALRAAARALAVLLPVLLITPALCSQDDAAQEETKQGAETKQESRPNVIAGGRPGPRPPANPKARLEIKPGANAHNFGRVRQGDELTHTFVLLSSGEEAVIISQASPSCGCLVGQIKTRPPGAESFTTYVLGELIEPGTEITMETVVNTISKIGRTKIQIDVSTNESRANVSLILHADIEPVLYSTPAFLQMGDIPMGLDRTRRIDIRTSRGEVMTLSADSTRKVAQPPGFSYEVTPVLPDADGRSNHWRATVHVAADAREGPGGYGLVLVSDIKFPDTPATRKRLVAMSARGGPVSPRARFFSITTIVNYRVLGAISVTPPMLSMGLVHPGTPVVRSVRLSAADPKFDLSGAQFELRGEQGQPLNWAEHFSTSVEPVANSNAVTIKLTVADLPQEAAGSFRGQLVITTGHPDKPEIIVRFSGVVQRR